MQPRVNRAKVNLQRRRNKLLAGCTQATRGQCRHEGGLQEVRDKGRVASFCRLPACALLVLATTRFFQHFDWPWALMNVSSTLTLYAFRSD